MDWFAINIDTWRDLVLPDKHIDCKKFLKSCRRFVGLEPGYTGILDKQQRRVILKARVPFRNNVQIMCDYYDNNRNPDGSEFNTVHEMIVSEMVNGVSDPTGTNVAKGLLWFGYTMQMVVEGFKRNIKEDNCDESLPASIKAAYNLTLDKHHNPIVKPIFIVAMLFCPNQEEFFELMTEEGGTVEQTIINARVYFDEMDRFKDRLIQYCGYQGWDVQFGDESNDPSIAIEDARKRKRTEDDEKDKDLVLSPVKKSKEA